MKTAATENAALIQRLADLESEAEKLAALAVKPNSDNCALLYARLFVDADETAAKLARHRQAIERAQACA